MNELLETLGSLDWSPLFITLRTGFFATLVCFFLGVIAANGVMRLDGRAAAVLDSLFTLPMILPPTAMGFLLLLLFSRRRTLGEFLYERFGITIVLTPAACVIAASVIAFPLMYRNAMASFEQIDPDLILAGRTLGMKEGEIFRRIILPSAGPGIFSGMILTFARSMGEYGATSMLAGNIPGRTATIAQRIAMVIQNADYMTAGIWVVIVLLTGLLLMWLVGTVYNQVSGRRGHW